MRNFATLLSAGLLFVGGLFGAGELSNRRAPGFSLMDTTGEQHDLQDYRGKVVLIDIMQTTCPHCRAFAKVLEEVRPKYGDRVAVLFVVNPPDNATTVSKFIQETKPSFPLLFDCGQMAISYMKATPKSAAIDVPHLFIVDAGGTIVYDAGYGASMQSFFEGPGLFAELDKILAAAPKKKR